MDKDGLIAFGLVRFGPFWIGLLAEEIGYDMSTLWRMARGKIRVSARVAELIASLPPTPATKLSGDGNPWKVVPSLNGEFEASSDGSLRRIKFKGELYRGRLLKPTVNKHGYPQVVISVSGKRMWVPVHRLIAETFIGPRPHGLQIDHIDGDKTNNAASNLEYVTGSENMRRAFRLGLIKPMPPRHRRMKPMVDALRLILNDPDNRLTDESRRIALEALSQ